MTNIPVGRSLNIVVQNVSDEVLIYDLNSNKAVCLNQAAALVFKLCNGKYTIADIQISMSKELENDVSR